MTQDCSTSLSTAQENKGPRSQCFPDGAPITEAENTSGSGIENISARQPSSLPWGYLHLHNRRVEPFKKQIQDYNLSHPQSPYPCFVHYSYRYKEKPTGHGVKRERIPTVSGLVFIQGETSQLQSFLRENFPLYHLVRDCSTGKPASIPDRVMQPFIHAASIHPERITFLRDPFIKFAQNRTKLRILTGPFRGHEGYIIRIDRDRQLVMDFGGLAVAIRGVHNEDFEPVE